MTDDEILALIEDADNLSAAEVWKRIASRHPGEWNGDDNWDAISAHEKQMDAFLRKAFSAIPSPPPMSYIDALTFLYQFPLLGVPDAEDLVIRVYQDCYQKMIEAVVASARDRVMTFAETPDTEVEPEDVLTEIARFEASVRPPRFLD